MRSTEAGTNCDCHATARPQKSAIVAKGRALGEVLTAQGGATSRSWFRRVEQPRSPPAQLPRYRYGEGFVGPLQQLFSLAVGARKQPLEVTLPIWILSVCRQCQAQADGSKQSLASRGDAGHWWPRLEGGEGRPAAAVRAADSGAVVAIDVVGRAVTRPEPPAVVRTIDADFLPRPWRRRPCKPYSWKERTILFLELEGERSCMP